MTVKNYEMNDWLRGSWLGAAVIGIVNKISFPSLYTPFSHIIISSLFTSYLHVQYGAVRVKQTTQNYK